MNLFPISIPSPMRHAIIDIGSNSTHLVIAEVSPPTGSIEQLVHEREQLRLVDMKDSDGNLTSEAVTRLSMVLKRFRDRVDRAGVPVRAVATFAMRDAKNCEEACEKIRRRTGITIDVASGQEEARLIHLGVTSHPEFRDRTALVLDIGGGSAEMVVGRGQEMLLVSSLKLGAVRLTGKFLRRDPIDASEWSALQGYIHDRLGPVCSQVRRAGFEIALASGGTAKALRSLVRAMEGDTERGERILTCEQSRKALEMLFSTKSEKERKALPGMDPKRADILLAGALVFDWTTRLAGVSRWQVVSAGVREGILLDTLAREVLWKAGEPDDVRWRGVRTFAARLGLDETHAWHVSHLAVQLFDGTQCLHGLERQWRECLRAAAFLHEAGLFLDYTGYHKHSWYLIQSSPLPGYSQAERHAIAAIARFHRKRAPNGEEEELRLMDESNRNAVVRMATLLRLAVSWDHTRRGHVERVVAVENTPCESIITISRRMEEGSDALSTSAEKSLFEQEFGRSLILRETPC